MWLTTLCSLALSVSYLKFACFEGPPPDTEGAAMMRDAIEEQLAELPLHLRLDLLAALNDRRGRGLNHAQEGKHPPTGDRAAQVVVAAGCRDSTGGMPCPPSLRPGPTSKIASSGWTSGPMPKA